MGPISEKALEDLSVIQMISNYIKFRNINEN
jgi:hypothetical protein